MGGGGRSGGGGLVGGGAPWTHSRQSAGVQAPRHTCCADRQGAQWSDGTRVERHRAVWAPKLALAPKPVGEGVGTPIATMPQLAERQLMTLPRRARPLSVCPLPARRVGPLSTNVAAAHSGAAAAPVKN